MVDHRVSRGKWYLPCWDSGRLVVIFRPRPRLSSVFRGLPMSLQKSAAAGTRPTILRYRSCDRLSNRRQAMRPFPTRVCGATYCSATYDETISMAWRLSEALQNISVAGHGHQSRHFFGQLASEWSAAAHCLTYLLHGAESYLRS
jgi:hypothetical protein